MTSSYGTTLRGNAVALKIRGWSSLDADGLDADASGLGPVVVFGPFEPVVGHLAFDPAGLAAQTSDGQEPLQQVVLEQDQRGDQEIRGKNGPA
ncbi:hypothetical protein [Streptomyces monomycini]|uniref:hypothetical protein n=1 Tax=Streptomyces monomycini TaxID=371720 RepID=UPI0012FEB1A5|nr:hypothetical protein [Streptomyces monomycini]